MNAPLHPTSYGNPIAVRLLFAREETSGAYGSAADEQTPLSSHTASAQADDLTPESVSDWARVHERVVQLGVDRAAHERELCRWLLAAERLAVPVRAGYASLHEYAERTVGLKARQTEERLRVGRALTEMPAIDDALRCGELCFSTVREITRVATAETEQRWHDWAKGRTVRQIEKAVAARRPGDLPSDRPDPSRVKHRLSFEVRAETLALR